MERCRCPHPSQDFEAVPRALAELSSSQYQTVPTHMHTHTHTQRHTHTHIHFHTLRAHAFMRAYTQKDTLRVRAQRRLAHAYTYLSIHPHLHLFIEGPGRATNTTCSSNFTRNTGTSGRQSRADWAGLKTTCGTCQTPVVLCTSTSPHLLPLRMKPSIDESFVTLLPPRLTQ